MENHTDASVQEDEISTSDATTSDVNAEQIQTDSRSEPLLELEYEPTVLEFTRFHGLSKNFQEATLSKWSLQLDFENDDEQLEQLLFPSLTDSKVKERLVINKSPAELLKTILTLSDCPSSTDVSDIPRKYAQLKVELPVLNTEPEMDMLKFGCTAVSDLKDFGFPLEDIDEENDEGLQWPSKSRRYTTSWDSRARAEKLKVSRHGLMFLQNLMGSNENHEKAIVQSQTDTTYERRATFEPVTPPLLPLSPPLKYFEPFSPAGYLEPWSDLEDTTAAELRNIDEELMKKDAIVPIANGEDGNIIQQLSSEDITRIYSPLVSIGKSASISPQKRKLSDLKVEGPLTPPIFDQLSVKKGKLVSFPDVIHDFIPKISNLVENTEDPMNPTGDVDAFFNECFTPFAEKAQRELENEQLVEADCTKRVSVPEVEQIVPQRPWEVYCSKPRGGPVIPRTELEAQRKMLLRTKHEDLRQFHHWHGVSKIERELRWSPFPPELEKIKLEEQIDYEDQLNDFLNGLDIQDIVRSDSLTWNPEGLRLFDDKEDTDEEVEPDPHIERLIAYFRGGTGDIHRTQIDSVPEENLTSARSELILRRINTVKQDFLSKHVSDGNAITNHAPKDNNVMFGSRFSAAAAISNFMSLHGKSRTPETGPVSSQTEQVPNLDSKSTVEEWTVLPTSTKATPHVAQATLPPGLAVKQLLPSLPLSPSPISTSIILSSDLLSRRSLIRSLEHFFTGNAFIYRDDARITPPMVPSTSGFSNPKEADEPDILISPALGLFLTTLQKIKQRPLPGQAAQPEGIKNRITAMSSKVEKLMVLVSEGRTDYKHFNGTADSMEDQQVNEYRLLESRNCEALCDLISYCTLVDADVYVQYVPGGEAKLAQWIAGLATRFSTSSEEQNESQLIQDETLWELFLRRAGFNAYAAQVVLSSLKSSYGSEADLQSNRPAARELFGLPAFVNMTPEERLERFQGVMGGARVLRKVNATLEKSWPSACDGFAALGNEKMG
ncbi:hypothetical protein M501DRAFT_934491 [Patellaria atrata CBS 101060]|uniref:Uncharacterized protein n=1 Tax=Patellaria atrata CBS 101060 TaxID=1346257 RepID=A0A9P4VMH8_9PEZI|nr:hypothetical protein M501DRAFT_934491 [Patellaria atrata CBS 101060]